MPRRLRWFEPNVVFEVTSRTMEGRFLLRPDDASRELILGVVARARALYPEVTIYAFVFLSNHFHLLISATHGDQIARFIGHLKGNIAKKIANLRGWAGPLWHRRSSCIPVVDRAALISRLKYVLAQSTKEGLVETPELWPGASSVGWLLGNRLFGTWIDRSMARKARDGAADTEAHALVYEIPVEPIPEWRELSRKHIAEKARELLDAIASEARSERGGRVLGAAAAQNVDPHDRPAGEPVNRSAPICHSSCQKIRSAFRVAYRIFTSVFRAAAEALKRNPESENVCFPIGSFPPSTSFVRAPSTYVPLWETLGSTVT